KEPKPKYPWYHNFGSYLLTNALFDIGCIRFHLVAFLVFGLHKKRCNHSEKPEFITARQHR
ncbi:MAG: hypothetical protein J1E34_07010, partial [Oscillospiraceae bacterium]|nr:hypothetical protein [Oscillospiraceae bacterium]